MKALVPRVFGLFSVACPVACALALLAASCGGAGAGDAGPVAEAAATTVTSESGGYRISVHSAPDAVPTRGVNTLQMVVTRTSDGAPAEGLDLEVVPWMPAMGHGASVRPSVRADAQPGVFTVTNVNLFMPGLWEIRTTIGGSASDHVTPSFEIL
jgi:hypothetical protein